jgi:hypothetical protein
MTKGVIMTNKDIKYNFMNTRKGDIFYKRVNNDYELRCVVIDYNYNEVTAIDLNTNSELRNVIHISFDTLNDGFFNERMLNIGA